MIMSQRILGAEQARALFQREAQRQGAHGALPEPTPAFVETLERELSGSVGTATAHAMVGQIVGGSSVSVEDLMADLEAAEQAMVLNLGATMEMLIKKRLADRLVPNMSAEDKEQVEEELELERDNSLNAAAAQQELRQATLDAGEDPDAPPAPEPAEGDPAPPEPGPDE